MQWAEARRLVPDFTDPASLGVLMQVVREAWGDPKASCWWSETRGAWLVTTSGVEYAILGSGPTEPEAWVAALEAKAKEVLGE